MLSYNNVSSTHYNAKLSSSANTMTFSNVSASGSHNNLTIPAGQIRSGKEFIPPTVGSYGHFEGMAPIDYHSEKAHRTSSNTWTTTRLDYERNRNFSPEVDAGVKRGGFQFPPFDNWKAAGENPQAREYVFLPRDTHSLGVIESFNERKLEFPVKTDTPVNLYVHDWFSSLPGNKVGEGFHRAREMKQEVINRASSRHGQEFYEDVKKHERSIEPVEYIAYGFRPKDVIASIARANDGKIILFYGEDGPKYKVDKELLLDEEFMHNARRSYDKVHSIDDVLDEEVATKTDIKEFNLRMAKKFENIPHLRTKYENRAEAMQNDIDTARKRYRELYRREHNLESIAESDESQSSDAKTTAYAETKGGKVIYAPREAFAGKGKDGESEAKKTYEREEKSGYTSTNGKVISIKSKSSRVERSEREESAKPDTQRESQHESNSESADAQEGEAAAKEAA